MIFNNTGVFKLATNSAGAKFVKIDKYLMKKKVYESSGHTLILDHPIGYI